MENICEELIKLNPWWKNALTEHVISRPMYVTNLLKEHSHIDILIGARRVGKTYILKEIISQLVQTYDPKWILYITAELPVLKNLSIREIVLLFRKIFAHSKQKKIWVIIDEVQELNGWQTEIKYLYDTEDIKFYLTGSSSLILNKKTSQLTGRYVLTHVFPLNYPEYLTFASKQKRNVVNYLETGGYPEYVLRGNDQLLVQTVESVLYRDLLSLYGIRNPAILKDMVQLLCDKISTPVSSTRIAKDMKIDVQTAQFYVQYLQDVYLVYPLFKKGTSHKIVKGSVPKYYINDTGILRLFSRESRIGHLAENAVFLHFYRKATHAGKEVFYDYQDGREIDFLWEGERYEVKMKPIDHPESDTIYIVMKPDEKIPARQISLERLLKG